MRVHVLDLSACVVERHVLTPGEYECINFDRSVAVIASRFFHLVLISTATPNGEQVFDNDGRCHQNVTTFYVNLEVVTRVKLD